MRLFTKLSLLLAAALLCAGCISYESTIVVKSDGSGYERNEIRLHPQIMDLLALDSGGRPVTALCDEMWEEVLAGEPLPEADLLKYGLNMDGECELIIKEKWDAADSPMKLEDINVSKTFDGGFKYSFQDNLEVGVPLPDGTEDMFLHSLVGMLSDTATPIVSMSLTLPGAAMDNNADRVVSECGKSTFIWAVEVLRLDAPVDFYAETDGDESSNCGSDYDGWVILLVIIIPLALIILTWVLSSRGRRDSIQAQEVSGIQEPDVDSTSTSTDEESTQSDAADTADADKEESDQDREHPTTDD